MKLDFFENVSATVRASTYLNSDLMFVQMLETLSLFTVVSVTEFE